MKRRWGYLFGLGVLLPVAVVALVVSAAVVGAQSGTAYAVDPVVYSMAECIGSVQKTCSWDGQHIVFTKISGASYSDYGVLVSGWSPPPVPHGDEGTVGIAIDFTLNMVSGSEGGGFRYYFGGGGGSYTNVSGTYRWCALRSEADIGFGSHSRIAAELGCNRIVAFEEGRTNFLIGHGGDNGSSSYTLEVTSMKWVVNAPPPPTPSPTPSPTAGPPQIGEVFGTDCVYTSTVGGITTTETIEASILTNGSFESGLSGWQFWQGNFADHVTGGTWSTIGPASAQGDYAWRYAVDGDYSAWKQSYDDTEHKTYLIHPVYVKGGQYQVRVGASVIAGESGEPGGRRVVILNRDLRGLDSVPLTTSSEPFSDRWVKLSGSFNSAGGGMYIGIEAGPGEASVYVDAVYAYLYARDPESGQFGLVCPGGDTLEEPPGYVWPGDGDSIFDLPDAFLDGVELDTGVEIVEGSTECMGFQERSIDALSLTVPGFGICWQNQQLNFASTNPLSEFMPLMTLVTVPMGAAVGFLILRWVRGSR